METANSIDNSRPKYSNERLNVVTKSLACTFNWVVATTLDAAKKLCEEKGFSTKPQFFINLTTYHKTRAGTRQRGDDIRDQLAKAAARATKLELNDVPTFVIIIERVWMDRLWSNWRFNWTRRNAEEDKLTDSIIRALLGELLGFETMRLASNVVLATDGGSVRYVKDANYAVKKLPPKPQAKKPAKKKHQNGAQRSFAEVGTEAANDGHSAPESESEALDLEANALGDAVQEGEVALTAEDIGSTPSIDSVDDGGSLTEEAEQTV